MRRWRCPIPQESRTAPVFAHPHPANAYESMMQRRQRSPFWARTTSACRCLRTWSRGSVIPYPSSDGIVRMNQSAGRSGVRPAEHGEWIGAMCGGGIGVRRSGRLGEKKKEIPIGSWSLAVYFLDVNHSTNLIKFDLIQRLRRIKTGRNICSVPITVKESDWRTERC
jgi:hypothetical protein